ncbi:Aldo/keto reductase-like protein [Thozetella sp. PMI_491]|nr:Aldo/keto reductase-like protein [Thozetella sp. PMI_491]
MAPPVLLPTRKLGKNGPQVTAIGFGMMGLSVAYGTSGPDEERLAVLDRAWELGCTNWDTSNAYGDCEDLIAKWFKLHPERRADIFLATKFGLTATYTPEGKFQLGADSTPENARTSCERSLKRLGVDSIDLFYVHRLNKDTPVEKTAEALAELKKEGKIKAVGLSEISSQSLRRAHKIVPIDAVQMEYSPWHLEIENEAGTDLLKTCRELGVTTFAYSPLSRGFLTGKVKSPDDFEPNDVRNNMPRFSKENFYKNMVLVDKIAELANKKGCTPSQLTLAWELAQGDDIVPIPGTKKIEYLEENLGAFDVTISPEENKEIRAVIESCEMIGHRNPTGFMVGFTDTVEL